ncbi:LysR family substrate-binding domain-containing protein [Nocardioides sp.]|uniref:LysR family substrate-binding domain-containing protein n=1 Tax=Nocardioides sp. TaxID=35761 RepID=UPI00261F0559|nr:LysR family substrate-binding domain-containing protein [Nocardioides sp.]
MTFRLGFVTGATPDKWARAWRDRFKEKIELVPLLQEDQLDALRSGEVTMALVRLPVPTDGLHLIRLYDEVQVAVAGLEHFIAAADDVSLEDLRGEQLVLPHQSGWTPEAEQLAWPPMSPKDAIETVAAGTGIALVPMSVGRLYQRKDTVQRQVTDLEPTTVGLAWLRENDDERTQAFVGITRGRTANSSRG